MSESREAGGGGGGVIGGDGGGGGLGPVILLLLFQVEEEVFQGSVLLEGTAWAECCLVLGGVVSE